MTLSGPGVVGPLFADLYELNMAASYLRRGMVAEATFSLFVRELPPSRGFLVAAGIETCCEWLEQFGFGSDELGHLASLGFDRATLDQLAALHFTGEVLAVPEGRIVFANEPILEVTAPIAEAQLVETYLLNQVSLQTMLATKAARCRIAAGGAIDLVEFGSRRAQGSDAAIQAARLSVMVGFSATSNVEAARRFGLEATGTMAHSYVEAFADESEAFDAFANDLPDRCTFLVDTYDTLGGVRKAIEVIERRGVSNPGIRLDSGDLVQLARASRALLDRSGHHDVRILVSGGLDEHDLARFVRERAPIDAAGVGTRLVVSADAPSLDTVYKLVAYDGRPTMKLSEKKATLPGPKQVFRAAGLSDVVGRRDEPAPSGSVPLLEPLIRAGRRVARPSSLSESRSRFEADLAQLSPEARDLDAPAPSFVGVSPVLRALEDEVRGALAERITAAPDGS